MLGAVASALAQAGTIAPALEVARAIEEYLLASCWRCAPWRRPWHKQAEWRKPAGRSQKPERLPGRFEDTYRRAEVLGAVAPALAQAGRMEEASRTLTDALEVARAIEDTYRRAAMLGAVASALAQAGTIAPALEVARAIADTSWRAVALRTVASALAQAGRMEEASRTLTEALEAARVDRGYLSGELRCCAPWRRLWHKQAEWRKPAGRSQTP